MASMIVQSSNPSVPSSSSSSSLSCTPGWTYDVFLSFRGEDTRKKFTDHLYNALDRKGIYTFKDDEKLKRGKEISPQLLKAIEESRYSIVVLSENYASSRWCLDELVKILECRNEIGQTVIPVFYHVNPSEVGKQEGKFGEGFAKVFLKNEKEKVQKWRKALVEVANLSGWPYPSARHRFESKFIQELVGEIFLEMNNTCLSIPEDLVGMVSRVEEVTALLRLEQDDDVRVVGLWGMGGIGKTTIAKAVYDHVSHHFEGNSYLENVREVSSTKRGRETLQEQLIRDILMEKKLKVTNTCRGITMIRNRVCHKRVLIVLDDVDQSVKIEELVGKHDWFAFGSRFIITTRDKHLLAEYGVKDIYEVERLGIYDSVKLFNWKAFGKGQHVTDFNELVDRAIGYAGGVPLALKVLGSFLYGRSKCEWESALNRLKEMPDKEIHEVLKISYDGLHCREQQIFLDIACSLKGKDKKLVTKILNSCGFYADIGISVLVEKSLITVEKSSMTGNRLWMHDLIQELGREIVRQESKMPGKRSRLWHYKDVHHVLTKFTGTEAIESIFLQFPAEKRRKRLEVGAEAFSNMKNLRLLKICEVDLPEGLNYLSEELRCLHWHGYPSTYMPRMFQPEYLVELNMSNSSLEQLWEGTMLLPKLRVLNLSESTNLTKSPDFTRIPDLEMLAFQGMNQLSKLNHLELVRCERLQEVPELRPGIPTIDASDCQSLRTVLSPSTYRRIRVFRFTNCIKLVENKHSNILDVLLANQFQGKSAPGLRGSFDITFPGSEIPKWFSHRNDTVTGSSVSVQLAENWYNSSLIGFVFCAVIGIEDTTRSTRVPVKIQISTEREFAGRTFFSLGVNTENVWIKYSARGYMGLPRRSDLSEFEVSYISDCPGLMVKKCGVHLLYKDDVFHGGVLDRSMQGAKDAIAIVPKRR